MRGIPIHIVRVTERDVCEFPPVVNAGKLAPQEMGAGVSKSNKCKREPDI